MLIENKCCLSRHYISQASCKQLYANFCWHSVSSLWQSVSWRPKSDLCWILLLTSNRVPLKASCLSNRLLACTQTLLKFFLSFFLKTSGSEASAQERAWSERKKNKERLFSYSPTTTPLHWQSINPLRFIFYHPCSTEFEEKIEGLWTG